MRKLRLGGGYVASLMSCSLWENRSSLCDLYLPHVHAPRFSSCLGAILAPERGSRWGRRNWGKKELCLPSQPVCSTSGPPLGWDSSPFLLLYTHGLWAPTVPKCSQQYLLTQHSNHQGSPHSMSTLGGIWPHPSSPRCHCLLQTTIGIRAMQLPFKLSWSWRGWRGRSHPQ